MAWGRAARPRITSYLYPLILLGGFFATLRWLALSFMPSNWAGVTAFVALFATAPSIMFQPGHLDHHGLIVMMVALALGCAIRMAEKPDEYRWGLYAGLLMAVGLTIALEILPWLLLLSAWLGFWAVIKGGRAAVNGLSTASLW